MAKARELNDYNIKLEEAYLAQEKEFDELRQLKLRVDKLTKDAETSGLVKTKESTSTADVGPLVLTGKEVHTE